MLNPLRLPPFGKSIDDNGNSIRLFFESPENWQRCHRESALGWQDILLLPANTEVKSFRWPVFGKHVLVFDHYAAHDLLLRELCELFLEHGAKSIYIVRYKTEPDIFIDGMK